MVRILLLLSSAILFYTVLVCSGCSSRALSPGVFRLDPVKSKFVNDAAAFGLDLEVSLDQSGSFTIQPIGVAGTWRVDRDVLRLTASSASELLNAMEGRAFQDRSPLEFKMHLDGQDRIVWKPSGFSSQRPLELVFTRSSRGSQQ